MRYLFTGELDQGARSKEQGARSKEQGGVSREEEWARYLYTGELDPLEHVLDPGGELPAQLRVLLALLHVPDYRPLHTANLYSVGIGFLASE